MGEPTNGTQKAIGGLETAVKMLTTSVRDLAAKFDRYDEKQESRMLECQKYQREEISAVKAVAYNPPSTLKSKVIVVGGYSGLFAVVSRLAEIIYVKITGG